MSADLAVPSTSSRTYAMRDEEPTQILRSDLRPSLGLRTGYPDPQQAYNSAAEEVRSTPIALSGATAATIAPEKRAPTREAQPVTPSGSITEAKTRSFPKIETPSPAPVPVRRSAQQYIALARPMLIKRLMANLEGIAEHAKTPSAGVYVYHIDQLATDALERFFDDGFLDLLLAVRNALTINNAWMRYTTPQIQSIQAVIRKYASFPGDNGQPFRQGILELNHLGIDTTPFDLPAELLFDEEE